MTATYAKFTLQLNTVTDADVIEYLAAQANKNDTIRRALRYWATCLDEGADCNMCIAVGVKLFHEDTICNQCENIDTTKRTLTD